MRTTEIFFVMIVNEIKCHVNTLFSSGEGMHPLHPPLFLRLNTACVFQTEI